MPQREIVIGKALTIQGRPALIASITEQDGTIKMWMFHHQPSVMPHMNRPDDYVTKREEIIGRVTDHHTPFPHIEEIAIQGQTLSLAGSSICSIGHNPTSCMKLQHFAEAGVDLSPIDGINLDELALGEYKLQAGSPFPEIDTTKEMPISLRIGEEEQETLIEPPLRFSLPIGELPADSRYFFHDPVLGREMEFYINQVIRHDLWKEIEEQTKDEALRKAWKDNGLDDEQINKIYESHREAIERICPRDHDLLILQYEAEDDVQLCFYTSEHLGAISAVNEGSSIGIIFSSGEENSLHGYLCRTCQLRSVPKDYNDVTDVELISWYRKVPGEQIAVL